METLKPEYNTCNGPSMHPTLRPGDGIEPRPYRAPGEMRAGDVVVYPRPGGSIDVVHRIIEVRRDGVVTRGDNNDKVDPYVVPFDAIVGRVTAAKRRNRRVAVRGGRIGLWVHKLALLRMHARRRTLPPLRRLSDGLAASGVLHVFHSALNLGIVRIERNDGVRRILVRGNRPVGTWSAGSPEWRIRFPYNLFVDKRRLERRAGERPS